MKRIKKILSGKEGSKTDSSKIEEKNHKESKAIKQSCKGVNEPPPLIYNEELNDPLERVFEYLSIQDLARLLLVSLKFNEAIDTFINGQLKRLQQSATISTNLKLYLSKEIESKEVELPSLKLYALTKQWEKPFRRSIFECSVTWRDDSRYFSINYSEKLNRKITNLIMVCWLNIQWTFADVIPGKYEFKMRLNISGGYPSRNGTDIYVEWEDKDGSHKELVKLDRSKFDQLRTLRDDNVLEIKDGVRACNHNDGFFDFVLGGIYISSICNVKCCLSDCNGEWKHNMQFDYMELTPVDD